MFFQKKIKLTTWLFLGGVLLFASPQKAEAFFRMSVSPATINAGETTTLTLHVSNDIVLCLRDSDDGAWRGEYTPISSGDTFILRPVRTMRYRVKCQDNNGFWVDNNRLEEIRVIVNGGDVILPAITFSPNPIQSGDQGTLTLSLDTTYAYNTRFDQCRYSNGGTVLDGRNSPLSWSGLSIVDYVNSFPSPISTSSNVFTFSARPTDTLTWSIDCLDVVTGVRTGVISEVWTVTSPTASLFAIPSSVAPGGQSTLYWDSTSATSCTASSTDNSWTGPVATSGNVSVSPLVSTAYSIFCTSANNVDSPMATSTVTIEGTSPTIDLRLTPSLINAGGSTLLTWTVTNAATCTASSTDGMWSGNVSNVSGSATFFPPANVSYTLDCTSASGGIASKTTILVVGGSSCNNGTIELGEACDNGLGDGGADNGSCPAVCSLSCTLNNCAGAGGPVVCADATAACRSACEGGESQVGRCGAGSNNYCCKVIVSAPVNGTIEVTNPIGFNTVQGSLDSILGTLQAIIAIISIIFIVIGGILYITAAGDESRVKTAKGAITAAMIGLALGVAAPSFLKQIGDILGWGAIPGPVAGKSFLEIATSVLNFLLSVTGIIGVIMLVVGGIMYITSAGDEGRMDTGKKIVQYSIIGIAVSLGALVLVTQLAEFFG